MIWLAAIVLASLPAVMLGQLMHQLNTGDLRLGTREWAGGVLAGAVLGGLAGLVLAGRWVMARERTMALSSAAQARLRRGARVGLAMVVVAGLIGLAVSSRGFTGEISNLLDGFAGNRSASNFNPQRLLRTDSYRWVWWKEAAAAFGGRPLPKGSGGPGPSDVICSTAETRFRCSSPTAFRCNFWPKRGRDRCAARDRGVCACWRWGPLVPCARALRARSG